MFFCENRSALVTGASSGIGLEIARQLAPRVETLVLVARRADRLHSLAKELESSSPALRVVVEPCDLASSDSIDALVGRVRTRIRQVDLLINNAGFGERTLIEQADWSRMKGMIDVNISAMVQLVRAFAPGMIERGHGGILNVGSGAGRAAVPNGAIYTASKHFVKAFTESLRCQLDGTGVHVTELAPGPVGTEFGIAAGIKGDFAPGQRVFQITADECAREALAGFEQNRAVVTPGAKYRLLMFAQPLMPRGLMRVFLRKSARQLRGDQAVAVGVPHQRPV